MIRIYKNDCEDFNNNGLGILTDFKTSPKIKESLNSSFELNFDYALKGKNAEYLVVDNVIKAPYDSSYQLFRIKKVKPSLTKISVYAVHIFYDLSENFLSDVAPTNKSGVNAISWMLDNAMFPTTFSVTGDLIPDNSARYVRKNLVEAILGADNCVVKRWGGEIERDNYNIILHNQRGEDKGVYIKQGKNIKEIEISIDFTSVVTRVIPQGANELLLPEYQIDSPLINTYRNPIVAKYEFSDISVDENTTEEQAFEKLREVTNELFSKEGIDKPKISVKVDWLELSKTEEYRYKYSNFESVRLGDTVRVQALGYEYKIRVITIEYDCLLKRYTSFEIGDPKADYVAKQSTAVEMEIQKSSSSLLERAKQAATSLINNGFGGHVRIYPDKILIMDTEDEATAVNVWQWNLNGFAHSSTGVNGNYGLAMTIDGQIVADRITTGTMDVQRINGLASELGKINTAIEINQNNITAYVTSTKKDIEDLSNSLEMFSVDLSQYNLVISSDSNNKPYSNTSYTIDYYGYFKGKKIIPNVTINNSQSGVIVSDINGKLNFEVKNSISIENKNFVYEILFEYINEETTYSLIKKVSLALALRGNDGIQGADGTSSYFHIKWSENGKHFSTPSSYASKNTNDWEIGQWGMDGNKQEYPQRIRLKELIEVPSNSVLILNTFNSNYLFVIRTYDSEGNYLNSLGAINNENTITLSDVAFLGVTIMKNTDSSANEGENILNDLINQDLTPLICLQENYSLGTTPSKWQGTYVDDNPTDSDNFDDYTWNDTSIYVQDDLMNLQENINQANTNINNVSTDLKNNYLTGEEVNALQKHNEESLKQLKEEFSSLQLASNEVLIEVGSILSDGVNKIKTATGYTFDENGLDISKDGEEMHNSMNNEGMYVKRDDEEVLGADASGVRAENITVRNYLTIGKNSRFEDYKSNRTGCFFVGGGS